jgi:hypothetical protein
MGPERISHQLSTFLSEVERSTSISTAVKRNMILFVDRVVEVVEQAFREILRLSVELKYIPDEELTDEGIRLYSREAEQLRERDKYRDVHYICGRLHVLRRQFHEEGYYELTQGFDSSFRELVYLIDDREGELIRLAEDFMHFVFDLLRHLQEVVDNRQEALRVRDQLSQQVAARIPELERSLNELQEIHHRILPTAGGVGLIEILSGRPTVQGISIDASQHVSVTGGDFVGGDQKKAGRDIYEAQGSITVGMSATPQTLEEARSALMTAVQGFPADRRELVQNQIDELVDAINSKTTPSEIARKAKALEMFLESGKELLTVPAKAAWTFIKKLVGA